jgi:transposase
MNNNIEYVGIDYHTKFAVATRMQKDGTIISKDKVMNTKTDIQNYLSLLPQNSKLVLEATNNWYAFMEWSHDLPLDVKLAHPLKLKAIAQARIKTDSIDSKILADLLRSDFIPESYIAPKEIRDVRELVRYRTTLVRIRTQFITRIHAVLFKVGEKIKATDVTGEKGREELKRLNLREIYQQEIDSCLRLCDSLKEQIELFSREIEKKAILSEDAKLLMSIPGISFFSSLLITSEIGDYHRFPSSRKLCSFAGLVPSVYASGGKTRLGRITKLGSANLRFVLLQAVPHVVKKSNHLGSLYFKVRRKHGEKVARIAVARRLLAVTLTMLRARTEFRQDC